MEAAPGLAAAIDAARAVERGFFDASDGKVADAIGRVEELGRLADALRIAVATEAERRSDARLGEGRLAFASGARDAVEMVQQRARMERRDAKRRIAIGRALEPRRGLLGEVLPGRYQAVADAVNAGRIGVESARVIVNAVKAIRLRARPDGIAEMIGALIGTASTADTEIVHEAAAWWALALDPDGAEPKERAQRRKRSLTIGRTLLDGTSRATMVLTPELLARLKEVLQSRRRGVCLERTEPGGDVDTETTGPEWREERGPDGEQRTREQQDLDTLFEVLDAGMAAETVDTSTAVTHETVVTITATELEARRGQGFAAGVMAGLPIPVIERQACTGGIRLMVLGDTGEPLHLGHRQRLFSPAQRRALTVAAGGRCQYPRCRVPAPYLEAHHAEWWTRDGGATDIGNGIMLCSCHRHLIHAGGSPVRIVCHDGDLFVVPQNRFGPPDLAHRRQTGPPGHMAA